MEHFKFKCKVCSDGRLYAGGWCHESVIPKPLPPNEILLDDLSAVTRGSYTDYLWDEDAQKLIYSPAEKPAEVTAPAVQTTDTGTEVTYS